ncbi:MAG: AAA family ATPase [Chloroflexota bacterium]
MTYSIAVAGKGGTGKTSLASLIIRYLVRRGKKPILAIDADPNANLGEGLGLRVNQTIGRVIASFNQEKINIPSGMTKEMYITYKLNETIVESGGIDLVTMGRGEGDDCYCYPNLILRKFMDQLAGNYPYLVMDNEAGMEHLSRRTTSNIDELLIVSDHSMKGVRTVARIRELVKELRLDARRVSVVINLVPGMVNPLIAEEMARLGLNPIAVIPLDEEIREYDIQQKPLLGLPDDCQAAVAVNNLTKELLSGKEMAFADKI